jgi:hypothetical protein
MIIRSRPEPVTERERITDRSRTYSGHLIIACIENHKVSVRSSARPKPETPTQRYVTRDLAGRSLGIECSKPGSDPGQVPQGRRAEQGDVPALLVLARRPRPRPRTCGGLAAARGRARGFRVLALQCTVWLKPSGQLNAGDWVR